ncbi:MAG: nucleotide exchange factor GrpE [Pseudomonadota bacterium]
MSDEKNETGASSEGDADAAQSGGGAVKFDAFDGGGGETDANAEADAETTDVATLQARIAQLETELSAKNDQHLRAVAEVQNIRRRSERDRREAEQFGGTKLARDLLPVYDNLDEALRQASDALKEQEAGFFNGVSLTRKVMLDGMAKHQITPIDPDVGERFDPNRHQAMYEAPVPGAEPGSVIQVMQSGFMIADRLLRPAMVGVASAASASAAAPAEQQASEEEASNGEAAGETAANS